MKRAEAENLEINFDSMLNEVRDLQVESDCSKVVTLINTRIEGVRKTREETYLAIGRLCADGYGAPASSGKESSLTSIGEKRWSLPRHLTGRQDPQIA